MIKLLRKTQPVYIIIDLACMLISFWGPYILHFYDFSSETTKIRTPNFTEYCFIFLLEATFVIIAFKQKKLYSTDRELSIPRELLHVTIRICYVNIIVGSIIFFTHYLFFSRLVFFTNLILLCILLGGWRLIKRIILRKLIREGFRNINILIVGAGKTGKLVLEEVRKEPHWGFNVVGFLDEHEENPINGVPVLGKFSNFVEVAKKYFIDEVLLAIPSEKKVASKLITQARKMRLGARIIPEHLEEPLPILDVSYLGVIPLLTYKERKPHPSEAILKRVFDLAISLILIILLFLPFIIIAVLIKIDSQGPVFFIQKRVGLKAKIFNFYKFRSMVKDADKLKHQLSEKNEVKDKVIFKIKKDPRITRLGKYLRKHSIDELPQLFNVLRGNMSLVGPRPPLPDEIEKYDNPHHMDRLSIKPGITGLSQIRGRSDLSFSQWVRWDLWYINHWSFGLDLKILLWTIPAVLKGKGAY